MPSELPRGSERPRGRGERPGPDEGRPPRAGDLRDPLVAFTAPKRTHLTGSCLDAIVHRSSKETIQFSAANQVLAQSLRGRSRNRHRKVRPLWNDRRRTPVHTFSQSPKFEPLSKSQGTSCQTFTPRTRNTELVRGRQSRCRPSSTRDESGSFSSLLFLLRNGAEEERRKE